MRSELISTILFLLVKGDKWGAYTDSGKLITNPAFDSIGLFWD